jgi:Conjugative transposon protein TcpC
VNEPTVPLADARPLDLGGTEPPPPAGSLGAAALRTLARVLLWSLIALGALRGLAPPLPGAGPAPSATVESDGRAAAVAAAFLREYLTVDGDPAARAGRLGRFTAAGVDLERSVSMPAGSSQYVDQVVAAGARPVDGGVEVTVLAHLLQLRSGAYRDAGTVAFVVPLAAGRGGSAVSGVPRPTALPVAAGLRVGQPPVPAPELALAARRTARAAVAALLDGDVAALARLGGGAPPGMRSLPPGWRGVRIGSAEVGGPPAALTARVSVRVRPPAGDASYLVPVRVRLQAGPGGRVLVRNVDAGGAT